MYFVSLISVFLVVSIFEQPYSRSNPTPQVRVESNWFFALYFFTLKFAWRDVLIFHSMLSLACFQKQSVDPISGLPLIPSGGPMPGYLGPPPPGLLNGPPNLPNINAINSMNSGIPLGGTSSINPIGVGGYPNVGRNGFPGPQGSIPYGSGQVAPVRGSLVSLAPVSSSLFVLSVSFYIFI